jgi:hypothetical protein
VAARVDDQTPDSPPLLPTLKPSTNSNTLIASSGSKKVPTPGEQVSQSPPDMSSSTLLLDKSRLDDMTQVLGSSADRPKIASMLVSRAHDSVGFRHFQENEHPHGSDAAGSDGLFAISAPSQTICSLDPRDYSASQTDTADSTAQAVSEDASTSNTESGLNDLHHHAPSQRLREEDVMASDVDEHELTETEAGPSFSHAAESSFGEARFELERLRLGIGVLEDSSESASDVGRSEPDIPTDCHYPSQVDSETNFSDSANDNEEGSGDHHAGSDSACVDTGRAHDTSTMDSTAQANGRKRRRLSNANDDGARAEVCLGEKRSRPSRKRFVCCFRSGPGQKCSGTDDTISEVLKNLSEQHNTHVCDCCWVRKVKDESSGRFVHPPDALDCRDHCLSPQCHRTTPTIGHRHKFDQGTCKTKTSRVRPGDGEAVYRFVFSLVHPTLESPAEVVTAEYSLHLGAVPRQGRRRANREELTAQADLLGEILEDLDKKHAQRTGEIDRLEQELLGAHSKIERDKEKTASLEAKMRRVVAILGDALRTGEFRDQQGHRSLLMRVGEDAPDALSLLSHPSPSPPDSTNGQQPSFLPTREKTNATAECQLFQNAYPMIANSAALDKTPHGNSLEIRTSQVPATGMNVGDQEMEIDWLNLLDESGNTSNISANLDGFS